MSTLPEPGYMKWDGIKFILVPDIEAGAGPTGPTGPSGPTGSTGPQGATGATGADAPEETVYLASFVEGEDTFPMSLTPSAQFQLGTNTSNLITVTVLATNYYDRTAYQFVFKVTYHPPSYQSRSYLVYPIDYVTDTDILSPYSASVTHIGSGLIEIKITGDSAVTTNFAATIHIITATSLGIAPIFMD